MYEQHFGLKKRPFRASATGTDVFVGPQIAATMAGLKKALSSNDGIVTISGPVGSGKTTLVTRALESISSSRSIIHIARMRLDANDVLEFLLDELGVEDRPSGTIQKFACFRRRLKELENSESRVFIAVEDAVRLGADTLAEIEALTSADAGESEGASVVLMGDSSLDTLLGEAQLVRMQQRIRQRFSVTPLCTAELRGYLRHCFRLAGGDFERAFEANAPALLHHLSDGIPRIANNLVESAMIAAADQDLEQVPSTLLSRVAENEYGLSAAGFDLAPELQPAAVPDIAPVTEPEPEPEPVFDSMPEPEPTPEPVLEPALESVPELVLEPILEPVLEPEPEPLPIPELAVEEPVIVFSPPAEETPDEAPAEVEIPELIQDTLPDLEILAPEFAIAAEPESEPEPEPESEAEAASEPEPEPATAAAAVSEPEPVLEVPSAVESTGNEVPEWDRDPTMAELKPDLAALEQAMAFAQGDDPEPIAIDDAEPPPPRQPEEPEVIPEITLDHAISQRIESNLIDEAGEISPPSSENTPAALGGSDVPAVKLPQRQNKKADAELERIAAELAKAKSIEDVDDKLAETLFGDELNFIAARVLANPPSSESANDDLEDVATGQQVANGTPSADVEVTLEAPKQLDDGGMDLSASQRLKTVRALNADLHPSIREPELPAANQSAAPPLTSPESIEDQINTSMTQTLKALNVRPPVGDDSLDDDEAKGGFFSRFKRS